MLESKRLLKRLGRCFYLILAIEAVWAGVYCVILGLTSVIDMDVSNFIAYAVLILIGLLLFFAPPAWYGSVWQIARDDD